MKVSAIIPARLSSERLAKKVLLDINGLPMLMHVYKRLKSCKSLSECAIATDSQEIIQAIEPFKPNVFRTGVCNSGTMRVIEAAQHLDDFDVLINVQGDEPMIEPRHIDEIISVFHDYPEAGIATLVERFNDKAELYDPNNVKVVLSQQNKALYFSRSVIPYSETLESYHYKHIGVYAFRRSILDRISNLAESDLRKQERLEQLDWLVAEIPIYAKLVSGSLIGVDTQKDLERVRQLLT